MTLQQLDKWLDWIQDYCDEKGIESDIFGGFTCNEDGSCEPDEATYICIEVYDIHGFTDFDILSDSLDAVGVDYSNAEQFTGDGEYHTGWHFIRCRIYGFNIPLTK